MDRLRRILIGAFVGALLTLIVHPASRRFLVTPFADVGRSQQLALTSWIPRNLAVLPAPTDTITASLWMQAGADRLNSSDPPDKKSLDQLIEVASAATKGEPTNAFWSQMEAVFRWANFQPKEAMQAWNRASLCPIWDDYQSRRLVRVREELSRSDGGRMAWHSSAVYFERSTAPAVAIFELGRLLFRYDPLSPHERLLVRLATLRNARLLREWSRSVEVGVHGATLVDYVSSPTESPNKLTVRNKILARFELVNLLRLSKMPQEALEADEIFRTNDAWLALADPKRAHDNVERLSMLSVLSASLPGIMVGLALIGLLIRSGVWIFEALPKAQIVLQPPYAPAMGVLVGVALYLQTGLVLAAIAVSMCFGFLAFEPDRVRKRMPERMGPAFRWTVLALAGLFGLLLAGFWMGIGSPAQEILPRLAIPWELFGGNTVLLSLAVIVVSLLLLAAPAWAIVERIPTPFATVFTFREFSRRLAWGGLAAGVVLAPLAVYFDGQLRNSLDRLVTNEPAVYLMREQ